MADFEIAYGETSLHEGGYANDPLDPGGETFRGISRVYHPTWDGWVEIDRLKVKFPDRFVEFIENNPGLAELTKEFYRLNYWNPIRGDDIPNQHVANKVFDTGVNQGIGTSSKYLQEGLNLLNRDQQNYADIAVDGAIGPQTLSTLDAFLALESGVPDYLLKVMNILQASRYISIMRNDSTQERFARGWLNRVNLC